MDSDDSLKMKHPTTDHVRYLDWKIALLAVVVVVVAAAVVDPVFHHHHHHHLIVIRSVTVDQVDGAVAFVVVAAGVVGTKYPDGS